MAMLENLIDLQELKLEVTVKQSCRILALVNYDRT
jgi:hypothetical protein